MAEIVHDEFLDSNVSAVWAAGAAGNYAANLAATNDTPSVLTSATYAFVAADVGKLVEITGGTNALKGTYTIVSVLADAATLNTKCTDGVGALSSGTGAMYTKWPAVSPFTRTCSHLGTITVGDPAKWAITNGTAKCMVGGTGYAVMYPYDWSAAEGAKFQNLSDRPYIRARLLFPATNRAAVRLAFEHPADTKYVVLTKVNPITSVRSIASYRDGAYNADGTANGAETPIVDSADWTEVNIALLVRSVDGTTGVFEVWAQFLGSSAGVPDSPRWICVDKYSKDIGESTIGAVLSVRGTSGASPVVVDSVYVRDIRYGTNGPTTMSVFDPAATPGAMQCISRSDYTAAVRNYYISGCSPSNGDLLVTALDGTGATAAGQSIRLFKATSAGEYRNWSEVLPGAAKLFPASAGNHLYFETAIQANGANVVALASKYAPDAELGGAGDVQCSLVARTSADSGATWGAEYEIHAPTLDYQVQVGTNMLYTGGKWVCPIGIGSAVDYYSLRPALAVSSAALPTVSDWTIVDLSSLGYGGEWVLLALASGKLMMVGRLGETIPVSPTAMERCARYAIFTLNANNTITLDASIPASVAFTDLVATTATPSALTSAAKPFTSTDVGRLIQLTGGTHVTAGVYRIVSVSGATATIDRNCISDASHSDGTGTMFSSLPANGVLSRPAITMALQGDTLGSLPGGAYSKQWLVMQNHDGYSVTDLRHRKTLALWTSADDGLTWQLDRRSPLFYDHATQRQSANLCRLGTTGAATLIAGSKILWASYDPYFFAPEVAAALPAASNVVAGVDRGDGTIGTDPRGGGMLDIG